MNDAVISANTSPLATSRVVALVSGSVYDAVNGIDPDYKPLFVKPIPFTLYGLEASNQNVLPGSLQLSVDTAVIGTAVHLDR